jgi:predicted metalloprotease with PDZ domain
MKIILGLAIGSVLLSAPRVEYRLSFPNAVHHEVEVTATFRDAFQPVLEVLMSRSSPGRYALHEFAKNVYRFRADDEKGTPLAVVRPSPYGWNIAGHHNTVVVHYTLFGDRADGTYAGIDNTHAHLNLPATLVWAHGFEDAPASLTFELPSGSNWLVATQLKPEANATWSAPNLEWLMDSPVELSAHQIAEWRMGDQRFRMAVHHNGSPETVKECAKKAQAVVLEAAGVFGAFPKFDNGTYTFLMDYLPYVFGDGMEHRDSASISGMFDLKDSLEEALSAVSHEFFHAWNVRRIRPRSLQPFDFERANMCGELWFAEGFTNYYGPLLIQRAGLSTFDQFVKELSGAVNGVLTAPGRNFFSLEEMSEQAPFVDAARSIDPTNFPNTFISYYTYGQALAFGLDLSIRRQFPGKSLDDWMKVMWQRHPDVTSPYTLEDLKDCLAEATGSRAFAEDFFGRHITGRGPLDYQSLVGEAGLELRPAKPRKPWIGAARVSASDEGVKLTDPALSGSPLYLAGLDAGDEITRCDGKVIKKTEDFQSCFGKHSPGESLTLQYVSRGEERQTRVAIAEDPMLELVTFERAGIAVTEAVKLFRSGWLSSKALTIQRNEPVVN